MIAVWLRECWHRGIIHGWIVQTVVLAIGVIITCSSVGTRCGSTGADGGGLVVVERDVWQRRLWQGLSNEFTLLVLQVREVTGGLLLRESLGLGKTLLVLTLDDLGNTLRVRTPSVMNNTTRRKSRTLSTLWQQYSFKLPWIWQSRGM